MPSGKDDQSLRIAVLGAGMSGLAAVAKLKQAGYTQIDLFEKSDGVVQLTSCLSIFRKC